MTDRYLDLLKQGFMKPAKIARSPVIRHIIACNDCLNWHTQGKHTADAATRKANRARAK